MADVSMIGLGAMGSALARAMVSAGHTTIVWNRPPDRAELLVSLGASRLFRCRGGFGRPRMCHLH
ncbi:NAD(P)-binding domain-containing protein [Limibaculum sp. M0105]|uniref:NAD(P)-binding domain-containing protein n=1 Tax=Thermohalobaculum xanthum TaxID=2753746 RepID=A0A8J7MB49_9RHOB|nr:NAD(P)-binding domain-containing protein [Thermohalobaculum xanthum]MBK0400987.1 NAD(P)-binding domain-containing protein [Thermohalobaculum xanthum]